MEDRRPGCGRVSDEPNVIAQDSRDLPYQTGVRSLIASQIEHVQSWRPTQFGAVQLIAGNEIQTYTFRDERCCQAECVWLVGTAAQQSDFDLRARSRMSQAAGALP